MFKKPKPEAKEVPAGSPTEAQKLLKSVLEAMPHPVELLLFTAPGPKVPLGQAARQVIRALRDLSAKVGLRELGLEHELAKKYQVTRVPTILIDPERYHISWLGAPVGEEAAAFVQALLMAGHQQSALVEQARKVLHSIQEPRAIKIFVSPTCPYCPHQVINAVQAAIERPELVSLEIIDVQANPDLAEKYDALSTPTAFANDQLIARGAQPVELFMASLKELAQQNVFIPDNDAPQVETDLVIVGAGPAGLTAGIYAARSGLKSVVVEKGALGGQVATTPAVENYPGFTEVGGKALVDILVSHALQYANIFPGEEAMEITPGQPLVVTTNRRRFLTRAVLLATGAVNRRLGAPGEEALAGHGVSYCSTCDGPLFKERKVIMVGGGDSAVTEALHLHHLGVEVTLVHRRGSLRAQAHLLKSLKDSGIPVLYDTEVREIRGQGRVQTVVLHNLKTGEISPTPAEGVFVAIGYEPAVALAQKMGVEISPDGYIKKDDRHRTNVPGVYSAGDVEGGYKQIVVAAGQGAEAALAIFEDLVHPYWGSKAWPGTQEPEPAPAPKKGKRAPASRKA